uniref:Enoyl reductase (ER) domain-containing protein n=1 Tax=Arcella intermedia TaxID=1963864 RepID=A0A6B2L9W7_9EUKA
MSFKAVQVHAFGGEKSLEVHECEVPKVERGQVLVKLRAAGVNPVDTYIRSGTYVPSPALPWTPGKDAAGEVETVGEGVQSLKAKDRVWLSDALKGTYAQYTVVTADNAHLLPGQYSFAEGAALWTHYATAYHAVFHIGKVQPGETVLVHGATGGVGLACIYWASQIKGVKIIGTGGSEEGRKLLKEVGAELVFDHTDPNYIQQIKTQTDNKVDVVMEMLANVNLNNDLDLLGVGGRVCVIGNRGVLNTFNPRAVMGKRLAVLGVMLTRTTPTERTEIIEAIQKGLKENSLKPKIYNIYPLAEAPQTHIDVMKSHVGKIVIDPWM